MSKCPPTVIVDLDGTLIRHRVPQDWFEPLELLPETLETLREWWDANYTIIILTGRAGCTRPWLEAELRRVHIFYHQLITDGGRGTRYVVNDLKPYAPAKMMAVAVNLIRNEGLKDLVITD